MFPKQRVFKKQSQELNFWEHETWLETVNEQKQQKQVMSGQKTSESWQGQDNVDYRYHGRNMFQKEKEEAHRRLLSKETKDWERSLFLLRGH